MHVLEVAESVFGVVNQARRGGPCLLAHGCLVSPCQRQRQQLLRPPQRQRRRFPEVAWSVYLGGCLSDGGDDPCRDRDHGARPSLREGNQERMGEEEGLLMTRGGGAGASCLQRAGEGDVRDGHVGDRVSWGCQSHREEMGDGDVLTCRGEG